MRLLFLLFLSSLPRLLSAAPAPPDTLRPISPARLLGYTYANDLFFRTDYYFTQGMTLTLVHPALARLPVRHLLAAGPGGSTQYHGLTLRYDGFTPLRIQDPFIRVGDRPYAAYLYASFFRVSNLPARHQRLSTALELGFIGPAAGGRELQAAIHRVTGNAEPRGWGFQIPNAPVVGYRVVVEQQLAAARHAELLGRAEASVGTLYTYAGTGLNLRAGSLNPYFDNLGAAATGNETSHPAGSFTARPPWRAASSATMPHCKAACSPAIPRMCWPLARCAGPPCAVPAAWYWPTAACVSRLPRPGFRRSLPMAEPTAGARWR